MALIPCKSCHKTISSSAKQCPHCKTIVASLSTANGINTQESANTSFNNNIDNMPNKNSENKKSIFSLSSASIKIILGLFIGFFIMTHILTSNSEEIEQVKNGKLINFNNKTIGAAVDDFFANPLWSCGESNDGNKYVNVKGKILYHEKEINAEMQFKINKNDTFEINALEFNGIPQNNLMIIGLLGKMYGVNPIE